MADTPRLSFAQFAQRIRAKHPGAYDDLNDQTLASRVIAKYPQYADMLRPEDAVPMAAGAQPGVPAPTNPILNPDRAAAEAQLAHIHQLMTGAPTFKPAPAMHIDAQAHPPYQLANRELSRLIEEGAFAPHNNASPWANARPQNILPRVSAASVAHLPPTELGNYAGQQLAGNAITGPVVQTLQQAADAAAAGRSVANLFTHETPSLARENEILGQIGRGGGDVLGSALSASQIEIPEGALEHPFAVIPGVALGGAAQYGTEKLAGALGASPETQEMLGMVASLGAGMLGGAFGARVGRRFDELEAAAREARGAEGEETSFLRWAQKAGIPEANRANTSDLNLSHPGQAQETPIGTTVASAPPKRGDVSTLLTQLGLTQEQWDRIPADQQKALKSLARISQRKAGAAEAPQEESPTQSTPALPKSSSPDVPRFVQGAKPRYGYRDKLFELDFESPIDKALYTVAQTKKNASHDATMTWLRSLWPGTSDNDIVAKGQEVRTLIKGLAKDANPDDGPLRVPSSSPSQSPPNRLRNYTDTPKIATGEGRPFLGPNERRVNTRLRAAVEARGTVRSRDLTERQRIEQLPPDERDAEIAQLRSKLQAARTDTVTGLPNLKVFSEAQERNPAPLVAFIDSAGLKAFNDNFGHSAGDALLKAQAEALKAEGLKPYRVGGDEFAIRGRDPEKVKAALERARAKLNAQPVKVRHAASGQEFTLNGTPSFEYGIGPDFESAAAAENAAKGGRGFARGTLDPALIPAELAARAPHLVGNRLGPRAGDLELQPGEGSDRAVGGGGSAGLQGNVAGDGTESPNRPGDVSAAVDATGRTVSPGLGEGSGGENPAMGSELSQALSRWVENARARGENAPYDRDRALGEIMAAQLDARDALRKRIFKNPHDPDLQRDLAQLEEGIRQVHSQALQLQGPSRQEAILRHALGIAMDARQRSAIAKELLRPETTPASLWEATKNFDPRTREHLRQIFGPSFESAPRGVSARDLAELGLNARAGKNRGVQAALREAIEADQRALTNAPNRTAMLEAQARLGRRQAFLNRMEEAEARIATQLPMHEENLRAGIERANDLAQQLRDIRGDQNAQPPVLGRHDAERQRLFQIANDPNAPEAAEAQQKIVQLNDEDARDTERLNAEANQQARLNRQSATQIRLLRNLNKRIKSTVMQPAGEFSVNSVFAPNVAEQLSRYLQRGPTEPVTGDTFTDLQRPRTPEDIRAVGAAPDAAARVAAREQAFRNNLRDVLSRPAGLNAEANFHSRRYEALRSAANEDVRRNVDFFARAQRGETPSEAPNDAKIVAAIAAGDPYGERVDVAKSVQAPVEIVKSELPTPTEIKMTQAHAAAVNEYNQIKGALAHLDPDSPLGKQMAERLQAIHDTLNRTPKPDIRSTRSALDPRRGKESDCQ